MLYWPMQNVLYVEGYALDRFAEGLWALQPVHQNKVILNFYLQMVYKLSLLACFVPQILIVSIMIPENSYFVYVFNQNIDANDCQC